MKVDDLDLPLPFREIHKKGGFIDLFPPQEDAVKAGLLAGQNLVLATPTASGKTFVAELAMARVLKDGGQILYLVPLRALAYEKFVEFKKYEELGYTVQLEMGDLDSSKYKNSIRADIIIATAEKCDSLLRTKTNLFENIGLLVVDEVHLIGSDRGPVYEVLITRFRQIFDEIQVLCLSATIGNSDEISNWMDAKLVQSDWRPVLLVEEVIESKNKIEKIRELVTKSVKSGGQLLVFVNSRRSAESVAEDLAFSVKLLKGEETKKLQSITIDVKQALPNPTKQCIRLSECVTAGTAFHHAGLLNKQRILIEDAFKASLLKVIVATPTLAAGVNLPARTVILRDLKRYGERGSHYIPVLEYKQQAGRAGRPAYDKIGQVYVLAKTESEKEYIQDHYIDGVVEDIHSRLGAKPVLRFHILSSVASHYTRTEDALYEFFSSTFFGHQYGIKEKFTAQIREIVEELVDWGLIWRQKGFLLPTAIGSRVSELYIDPLTAKNYLKFLPLIEIKKTDSILGLLDVICDATEIQPYLRVAQANEARLWERAYTYEDEFLRDISGFGSDWQFLPRVLLAFMFSEWANEESEQDLLTKYNVAPGLLYSKLQNLEWLVYSARELASIKKLKFAKKVLFDLELRIKHGVKAELLPLVKIRGVGRVRARKLFNAGLKRPTELKEASISQLSSLVGKKTAQNILRQLT
ncbi:MAG: DEAD/DEAH box helicase [Candidatus Altiarchaeota archaeon]